MANLTTSEDIINDALFRAYEPTDGSSGFETEVVSYLNRGYRALWTGGAEFGNFNENWWWLKTEANIIIQPPITDGTVDVELARDTIIFSDPPSPLSVGRFIQYKNAPDVFKIAQHDGPGLPNATMDSVYTRDTEAEAEYRLMNIDFDLPTDLYRLVAPMRLNACQTQVDLVLPSAFYRLYPLACLPAQYPKVFTITDEQRVRFNTQGLNDNRYIRVDFDYMRIPPELTNDDSSVPLVPIQYRQILSDIVSMSILEQKNDTRATGMVQRIVNGVRSMVAENRGRGATGGEPMQIYPRGRRFSCNTTAPDFTCATTSVSGIAVSGCAISGSS